MTVLMGLASQLKLSRLQLVTDIRADRGDWPQFVKTVFDNGVDLLQVRDAAASRDDLLAALEVARAIAFDHRKCVVVGQAPAVAATFGADFLHLGAADGPTAAIRSGLPTASIIGRSVHSPDQLRDALADPGVGYLFVGPVQDTPVQGGGVHDSGAEGEHPAPGLDLVRAAAQEAPQADPASRPWFAVGGITTHNLDDVLDAGALRVAVAGAINLASDPGAATRMFAERLQQAWDANPAMEKYRIQASGSAATASFKS